MPDGVGTECAQHADLGRGFERRTDEAGVDALGDVDILGTRGGPERGPEAGTPGIQQVGEAGAERIRVRSEERGAARQVQVVGDDHQRAGAVSRVHAPRGVREQDGRRAETAHEQHRLHDESRVVPLVEVQPPLQRHDGHAVEMAQEQASGVSGGRRGRPAGEVGERDRGVDADVVGKAAEARPQHQPDAGHERRSGADRGLESVEATRQLRGRDRARRVNHGRTHSLAAEPRRNANAACPRARGAERRASPAAARVPTPGCRSRPAGRIPPGGGNEAPEATNTGSEDR